VLDVTLEVRSFGAMKLSVRDHKRYLNGGRSCVQDLSCGLLRIDNPEELVRQDFIWTLIKEYRWPRSLVWSEFPLARAGLGRGRVDVLLVLPDETPFAVMECKAPTVPLDSKCYAQAENYAEALGVRYIILTNRSDTEVYAYASDEEPRKVVDLPSYATVMRDPDLVPPDEPALVEFRRPLWCDLSAPARLQTMVEEASGTVSVRTPAWLAKHVLDLDGLFLDEGEKPSLPWKEPGCTIDEDWGTSYWWFGNAAGGLWEGNYRSFLVRDATGDSHVVRLALMASAELEKDPRFGNCESKTYLVVAVTDAERAHNALQLCMDRFTRREGSFLELWHDGRLTAGRTGAVKRDNVISFVKSRAPDLVSGDQVSLGHLPADHSITWTDAKPFLSRLIRYALIRDQFRNDYLGAAGTTARAPRMEGQDWDVGDKIAVRWTEEDETQKVYDPCIVTKIDKKHGVFDGYTVEFPDGEVGQIDADRVEGPSEAASRNPSPSCLGRGDDG